VLDLHDNEKIVEILQEQRQEALKQRDYYTRIVRYTQSENPCPDFGRIRNQGLPMNNSKKLSISLTKYNALPSSNDNTRLISAQLLIKISA
jgi:hypothetical protein